MACTYFYDGAGALIAISEDESESQERQTIRAANQSAKPATTDREPRKQPTVAVQNGK